MSVCNLILVVATNGASIRTDPTSAKVYSSVLEGTHQMTKGHNALVHTLIWALVSDTYLKQIGFLVEVFWYSSIFSLCFHGWWLFCVS